MFEEFSVVVPTYGQRLRGVLHPATEPRAGVLLLLSAGTHNASLVRIFTELELYLQAAGVVTLRMSLPLESSRRRRVSGVLGGVSLLRTLGAQRILIISSAIDQQATWDTAHSGTLAELVSLGRHGHEVPDILRILRDLTTTIRDVDDYTVGVATLMLQPWRAPTSALHLHRPTLHRPTLHRPTLHRPTLHRRVLQRRTLQPQVIGDEPAHEDDACSKVQGGVRGGVRGSTCAAAAGSNTTRQRSSRARRAAADRAVVLMVARADTRRRNN